MKHEIPATDVCYLTLPVDSGNQATSLASYLTNHGITAVAEANEVTVPLEDPAAAADVYSLRQSWGLFWQHSDAALFSLPVFVKPSTGCCEASR